MSFRAPRRGLSGLPLVAVPAIVLDTETTGLDVKTARIIEIAAVRLRNSEILDDRFDALVDPGLPIPPASTDIHGIADDDVAEAADFPTVFRAFADWAGDRVAIGYSIGFDLAVLKQEHARADIPWAAPRSLDVRHLLRIVAPQLPDDSLETAAGWLGLDVVGRHRALGDARITASVLLALLPLLRAKGIETLAQAERACRSLGARLQDEAEAGWLGAASDTGRSNALVLSETASFPYRHRVADVMSAPPTILAHATPLRDALRMMIEQGISSVFVGGAGDAHGILTERDVLRALDEAGTDALTSPLERFARTPLVNIEHDAYVYRAIARMTAHGFRHLGVVDEAGRLIGALSVRDLLRQRSGDALALGDSIEQADSPTALCRVWQGLTETARALEAVSADPRNTAGVISHELRALTRRAAELAERRMRDEGQGPPPVPYALLVLGSGGRGESLLAMDQDNAIVYAEGAPGSAADTWFKTMAGIVADTLDGAGVAYCTGGIMAKNDAWRMSADRWREAVARWVAGARPEDILNSDIFFDAVTVHGDPSLGRSLHREALALASANKHFIRAMAATASAFDSALGWFGRVKTSSGRIDLKKGGILPIFSAARVVALEHGIAARATPARLEAAKALDIPGAHVVDNLLDAHRILMGTILRQQLRDIEDGIALSNRVEVAALDAHEKQDLRWALQQSPSIGDLVGTPVV